MNVANWQYKCFLTDQCLTRGHFATFVEKSDSIENVTHLYNG